MSTFDECVVSVFLDYRGHWRMHFKTPDRIVPAPVTWRFGGDMICRQRSRWSAVS